MPKLVFRGSLGSVSEGMWRDWFGQFVPCPLPKATLLTVEQAVHFSGWSEEELMSRGNSPVSRVWIIEFHGLEEWGLDGAESVSVETMIYAIEIFRAYARRIARGYKG